METYSTGKRYTFTMRNQKIERLLIKAYTLIMGNQRIQRLTKVYRVDKWCKQSGDDMKHTKVYRVHKWWEFRKFKGLKYTH